MRSTKHHFLIADTFVHDFVYMKRTSLYAAHSALGAKIIPFAGFEMPVNYAKGIIAEHNAVRNAVGMFDVSHMGEVEIRGRDALDFVQRITINDASKLTSGKAQYSAMCYADGGIVDDLLVYCCGTEEERWYLFVINASNIEKDIAWMRGHTGDFGHLELRNVSDEMNLLAVQGPKSLDTLKKLTAVPLDGIPYYSFANGSMAGVEMILSRTGYTGELGMELYFKGGEDVAVVVWSEILRAGAEFGIEPIGLGARDTLRLEKGYCLYGNDIDQTTNPLEAGLGWITKLAKDDFVGKSALVAAKEAGLKRKLVGLRLQQEKMIPRQHYPITAGGRTIGEVTSGTISPVLGKGIALGYVEAAYSNVGMTVNITIRNNDAPAEVVKTPFV
jgi:aminomethyltransferase